jgi:hypothetical protein
MVALHFTEIKQRRDGRPGLARLRLFFAFRCLGFYYSLLAPVGGRTAVRFTARPCRLNQHKAIRLEVSWLEGQPLPGIE